MRLGLDLGSTTTKAVLLDDTGVLLEQRLIASGADGQSVAEQLRQELAGNLKPAELRVLATGYGRSLVEFAGRTLTEITCQAAGVRFFHPEVRTIIDIGGQDSKVIRLDAKGLVDDFAMNDRCAAGTGCFLDLAARRCGKTLAELSELYRQAPQPLSISSTCVVFAESEVIGLLAQGRSAEDILAGVQQAVARRIVTLARQVKALAPVYFCGGVALNETLRRELESQLEMTVSRATLPQLTAAYGAALLA